MGPWSSGEARRGAGWSPCGVCWGLGVSGTRGTVNGSLWLSAVKRGPGSCPSPWRSVAAGSPWHAQPLMLVQGASVALGTPPALETLGQRGWL